MIGNQYGHWTVLREAGTKKHYECVCVCGQPRVIREDRLLNGHTLSCGRKRSYGATSTYKPTYRPTEGVEQLYRKDGGR